MALGLKEYIRDKRERVKKQDKYIKPLKEKVIDR